MASRSTPPMTIETARWRARPVAATLVRVVAFAIPFAVGLAASGTFAETVSRPAALSVWVWRALVVGIATAAAVAVDPLARRLLPLAALLQMSLLFPDRAPSRLGLALGVGSASDLTRLLDTDTADHTAAEAATHVLSLVAALGRHDRITRGHSERVWGYARLIGAELDLSPGDADRLQWAALLHDVGKLYVAPEILNKRGKLTAEEWAEIKTHPEAGAELIAPLADWLGPWALAVGQHHERFDGTGYPHGVAGKDISLGGRIVAVIDTYDVITCARSYKRPISSRKARAELVRCAGSHFDPDIVDAFVNISTGRIRFAAGPLAGVAQLPFVTAVAQSGAAVAAIPAAAIPAATALAVTAIVTAGPVAAAPSRPVPPGVTSSHVTGPASNSPPTTRAPGIRFDATPPTTRGAAAGTTSPSPTPSTPTSSPLPSTPTSTPASAVGSSAGGAPALGPTGAGGATVHGSASFGTGGSTTPTITPGTVAPVTVPPVTAAPVTAAPVTVPPVTLPVVTLPPVTIPPITLPPVTLPPVTIPPITLPPVTIPPITLPPVTLPHVSIPPITLPPITLPLIKLPGL
jgi:hypothetical protein